MTNGADNTPDWHVSLSVAFPPDSRIDDTIDTAELIAVLSTDGPAEVVTTTVAKDRLDIGLSVNAGGVWEALESAGDLWGSAAEKLGFQDWSLLSLRGTTYEEILAETEAARFPDLVGLAEVAKRLGVTKQRVSELRKDDRLPEPLAQLASGPVWSLIGIEEFEHDWNRVAGRPKGTTKVGPAGVSAPRLKSTAQLAAAWMEASRADAAEEKAEPPLMAGG